MFRLEFASLSLFQQPSLSFLCLFHSTILGLIRRLVLRFSQISCRICLCLAYIFCYCNMSTLAHIRLSITKKGKQIDELTIGFYLRNYSEETRSVWLLVLSCLNVSTGLNINKSFHPKTWHRTCTPRKGGHLADTWPEMNVMPISYLRRTDVCDVTDTDTTLFHNLSQHSQNCLYISTDDI